jgi:hypothetical protein
VAHFVRHDPEMAMRQAPKGGSQLLESAGVDSTAFINITGQII